MEIKRGKVYRMIITKYRMMITKYVRGIKWGKVYKMIITKHVMEIKRGKVYRMIITKQVMENKAGEGIQDDNQICEGNQAGQST